MRHPTSPTTAVRGELRSALHDLAEALLPPQATPGSLFDTLHRVHALLDRAELGEGQRAVLELMLRQVGTGVAQGKPWNARTLATYLTLAADGL